MSASLVGSEMCIRDSLYGVPQRSPEIPRAPHSSQEFPEIPRVLKKLQTALDIAGGFPRKAPQPS
eukprot:11913965-Alexandrium_andersonii.AAC.1